MKRPFLYILSTVIFASIIFIAIWGRGWFMSGNSFIPEEENQKVDLQDNTTEQDYIVIHPVEVDYAFPNPLKGFRPSLGGAKSQFASVQRHYIKWNEIEKDANDGVDAIIAFCNEKWKGIEEKNAKVIPRVYLEWPNQGKYWPSDMVEGDYSSDRFKERVVKLIQKLGDAWDNDPRVAYIEMGLIGLWGEHHTPDITPEMEKILGDAFQESFKHKLIMVRHPWDFKDYGFGIYWDSFAHIDQKNHEEGIMSLGDRWKTAVMGGETAYNWGRYKVQPGDNPNDSLSDPVHRDYILDRIRRLHVNHLGWISDYDPLNMEARKGAEELQKAMGYRFVLTEVKYGRRVEPGGELELEFAVVNRGSTPFYYDWPVEVSLLNEETREPVWKEKFTNVDIRKWFPGDQWNDEKNLYEIPPEENRIKGVFHIPASIPKGEYILALSILDPAGDLPSVRFAIMNYYNGGRHPIGKIGIGMEIGTAELSDFDNLLLDKSLHYKVTMP